MEVSMNDKLLNQIPSEVLPLVSQGFISVEARANGPALAWAEWKKEEGRFLICILERIINKATNAQLQLIIKHELHHIVFNHFAISCNQMCRVIAEEIEANWWLKEPQEKLNAIASLFQPDGQSVNPKEWLEKLEFDPELPPSAPILHTVLHNTFPEQDSCFCGGITKTADSLAAAIATVVNIEIANAQGREIQLGYGNEPGSENWNIKTITIPLWAQTILDFSRSIVESALQEGRKYSRPITVFKQLGIYVPATKPKWGYKPKTVVLLVDTSGSMFWGNILNYVSSAISHITRHKIKVRLIAGDTKVTLDKEIVNLLPSTLPGGGGTDIRPLFKQALTYNPQALVCVTDTEIPAWPTNPNIDTLWIIPKRGSKPPFGKIARYEEQ